MRNDLRKQVESCLHHYPEARDSDVTLMIKVWESFYPKLIKQGSTGEKGVWLKDLYDLPREDNIKRVRAIIQNDLGRYLPTSWLVAKQRKIEEKRWREYVAQQTEHKRL